MALRLDLIANSQSPRFTARDLRAMRDLSLHLARVEKRHDGVFQQAVKCQIEFDRLSNIDLQAHFVLPISMLRRSSSRLMSP